MIRKIRENKYRYILVVIALVMFVSSCFGITYGVWVIRYEQEDINVIEVACFEMTFTELSTSVNLSNTYPISDEKGLETNPYTFKIENTCTQAAEYVVSLDIKDSSTTMDLSKVKVYVSGESEEGPEILTNLDTLITTESGIRTSYKLVSGMLGSEGENETYSLRVWMDESSGNDQMGTTFEGRLTITSLATNNKLGDRLISGSGGVAAIEAKGNPDFSAISTDTDTGMYAIEDDYGTSYYFRGTKNLLNNNVIFGGFQWKVIRVNGDGSIRMIYNGTEAQFNTNQTVNSTGVETQIGTSAFNTNYNDNAYVGYMYGTVGSTTYAATHTNTNSSTAKTQVDSWYQNNILNQGSTVTNKIADNLFCGDRNLQSVSVYGTGLGYGTNVTGYGSRSNMVTNKTPILNCQNTQGSVPETNDAYTVDDTTKGNGVLTYPVGLITAAEVSLAGGLENLLNIPNTTFYLYTNNSNWTMSPYAVDTSSAHSFSTTGTGLLSSGYIYLTIGIRPVISLNSNIMISGGDGSATSPYIID